MCTIEANSPPRKTQAEAGIVSDEFRINPKQARVWTEVVVGMMARRQALRVIRGTAVRPTGYQRLRCLRLTKECLVQVPALESDSCFL